MLLKHGKSIINCEQKKEEKDYDQGNNKKICVLSLRVKVFTHWFFFSCYIFLFTIHIRL